MSLSYFGEEGLGLLVKARELFGHSVGVELVKDLHVGAQMVCRTLGRTVEEVLSATISDITQKEGSDSTHPIMVDNMGKVTKGSSSLYCQRMIASHGQLAGQKKIW